MTSSGKHASLPRQGYAWLNVKKGFGESELGVDLGSSLRRPATAKALPVYLQQPTYLRTEGTAGQCQKRN
jgi:hypothetical protein